MGKWIAWNRQKWGEAPLVWSDVCQMYESAQFPQCCICLNTIVWIQLHTTSSWFLGRPALVPQRNTKHNVGYYKLGKKEKLTLLIIGSLIGLCKQKLYLWTGWCMIQCVMNWMPTWQVIKMNINEWRFSQTFIKYQQTVGYKNKWIQMYSVWTFIEHLHNYWLKFKTNVKQVSQRPENKQWQQ